MRLPRRRVRTVWSETWAAVEDRLEQLETRLRNAGLRVGRGGDFDRWDLDVRGGALAGARVQMAVEEHGGGRQQLRFRVVPRTTPGCLLVLALIGAAAAGAFGAGALPPAIVLTVLAVAFVVVGLVEAASAIAAAEVAIDPPAVLSAEPVTATPLLERIEGHVEPGEVVTVVGRGSGRHGTPTVLEDLLVGLYGSHDELHAPLTPQDVALLLAEPAFLPGSVADNIAFGRPGASREDVRAAARAAGADAFIQRLPRGYDTPVGRYWDALTDEQRHRLVLARVFLQDARVVILDEPIERIGNGSQAELREVIERLVKGRRTLIAADSPDRVSKTSRVFAVEGDRLVELA
jgi:ABC-type nitrate/sulfonate/bicarbonate transport system ATPase subunit